MSKLSITPSAMGPVLAAYFPGSEDADVITGSNSDDDINHGDGGDVVWAAGARTSSAAAPHLICLATVTTTA